MRRLSPREMKRLLRKLGMQLEEMKDIEEVIIVKRHEVIRISDPIVSMMKIGDQTIFQIIGHPVITAKPEEVKEEVEIPEEDIQLVASQAGVSLEEARRALMETGGDLAKAILLLTSMRDKQ